MLACNIKSVHWALISFEAGSQRNIRCCATHICALLFFICKIEQRKIALYVTEYVLEKTFFNEYACIDSHHPYIVQPLDSSGLEIKYKFQPS